MTIKIMKTSFSWWWWAKESLPSASRPDNIKNKELTSFQVLWFHFYSKAIAWTEIMVITNPFWIVTLKALSTAWFAKAFVSSSNPWPSFWIQNPKIFKSHWKFLLEKRYFKVEKVTLYDISKSFEMVIKKLLSHFITKSF